MSFRGISQCQNNLKCRIHANMHAHAHLKSWLSLYFLHLQSKCVLFFLLRDHLPFSPFSINVFSPTDGTTEASDPSRKSFCNLSTLLTSPFHQPQKSPDWDWTGKIWPKTLPPLPALSVPSSLGSAHTLHPACHPRFVEEPQPVAEESLLKFVSFSSTIILIRA